MVKSGDDPLLGPSVLKAPFRMTTPRDLPRYTAKDMREMSAMLRVVNWNTDEQRLVAKMLRFAADLLARDQEREAELETALCELEELKAEQCPLDDGCACAAHSRHRWFEETCRGRARASAPEAGSWTSQQRTIDILSRALDRLATPSVRERLLTEENARQRQTEKGQP